MQRTFIRYHKVVTSEVATVTHYTEHCQTLLRAREINLRACVLMILRQIIRSDWRLNLVRSCNRSDTVNYEPFTANLQRQTNARHVICWLVKICAKNAKTCPAARMMSSFRDGVASEL